MGPDQMGPDQTPGTVLQGSAREAAARQYVKRWLEQLDVSGRLTGAEVARALGEDQITPFLESVINSVLERPSVRRQTREDAGGVTEVSVRSWQVCRRSRTLDPQGQLRRVEWDIEKQLID